MKTYGGVDVWIHILLTSALADVSGFTPGVSASNENEYQESS
jgi:hypothetical protein